MTEQEKKPFGFFKICEGGAQARYLRLSKREALPTTPPPILLSQQSVIL